MIRLIKGRCVLLLDRNRDAGYLNLSIDGGGVAVMLDADDLALLGSAITSLSETLKLEGEDL